MWWVAAVRARSGGYFKGREARQVRDLLDDYGTRAFKVLQSDPDAVKRGSGWPRSMQWSDSVCGGRRRVW